MVPSSEFNDRANEFEKNAQEKELNERKQQYGFDPDKFSAITTKEEAERLKKNRPTPAPELNYELGGQAATDLRKKTEKEREERIDFIEDTLKSRAEKFEQDYEKNKGVEHPSVDDNSPDV